MPLYPEVRSVGYKESSDAVYATEVVIPDVVAVGYYLYRGYLSEAEYGGVQTIPTAQEVDAPGAIWSRDPDIGDLLFNLNRYDATPEHDLVIHYDVGTRHLRKTLKYIIWGVLGGWFGTSWRTILAPPETLELPPFMFTFLIGIPANLNIADDNPLSNYIITEDDPTYAA